MSVNKMREKYSGVSEDYLEILSHYHNFVDKEIMPRRRDLDGGPFHKDEELALKTVEEILDYTKAGGDCGICVPKINAILEDINKEKS